MSKKVNYNENLVAGAAIRDDKGRRISKLFEASHPKMTVGYAKNLIMPDDPTEQKFNFRQAGGGVIEDGVAVIDKVKGNSVVWNQAFNRGSIIKFDGLNVTYNQTTKFYDCRGNNTESQIRVTGIYSAKFKSGDKIMRIAITKNFNVKNVDANGIDCSTLWNVTKGMNGGRLIYNKQGLLSVAISEVIGDNGDRYFCYYDVDLSKVLREETDTFSFSYAVYNLTQMFGAGNEPSTYEEFLQRKPKVADEYAYNEGTIINNNAEKVVTTGINLWDEQWEQGSLDAQGLPVATTASIRSKEFNRCLPNCEICFSCQSAAAKLIYWYDVNKAFISRNEISNSASIYGVATSPANAYFFKVRNDKNTYNHDICINLSDPAINGQYFPYEKHELDLSWVKEIKDTEGVKLFEDGMKSAGTTFDEAGKNKAVKRFVVVDLGSLNWTKEQIDVGYQFYSNIVNPLPKGFGYNDKANVICPLCPTNSRNTIATSNVDGITIYTDNRFYLRLKDREDMTNEQFKASLQGIYAFYELAEPIEVEYDEKSLTYPVVAGGTEEAIASEPSSAFRADIGYGIDAVKTILDLKARVEALEGK